MRRYTFNPTSASTNPLVNFVTIVVGALVAAGALILGFLTFTVIAGIILVLAGVVAIRIWWFKRTLMRQQPRAESEDRPRPTSSGSIIEGEYQEVQERRNPPE